MSDFFQIKRQARRDVHAAFSVAAFYADSTITTPVSLKVRWHDQRWHERLAPSSGQTGSDYAGILENIDHVVFDADELAEKSVTPRRNGTVLFVEYADSILTLDAREPADGPLKVVWTVTRHGSEIVVGPGQPQNQVGRWRFIEDVDGSLKIRSPNGSLIPLVGG